MGEAEHVQRMMDEWDHASWGFVIYRCTYDDDAKWALFMNILNQWTRQSLESEVAADLMESLDWVVQEGSELENAGKQEVRRLFRQWVASRPEAVPAVPRYRHCIMVDNACLESILNGPQPSDEYGDLDGEGYVYLIDSKWEPREGQEADEGYPPIEDCRMEDVGWTKVCLDSVAPRAYNVLEDDGWDIVYTRPPKVADP